MIFFKASVRHATAATDDAITTSSVGIPVSLSLATEFTGLAKTVVFKAGSVTVDIALIGDADSTTVPPDVLTESGRYLSVGIYAADGNGTIVIPTVWAVVGLIQEGAVPSGVDPAAPTPSWVAQVQAIASEANETAATALETANDVAAQAQAGDFDGEPGPQGEPGESPQLVSVGYKYAYVPHITSITPSTWYDTEALAAAAYGDIAGSVLCTRITYNWQTGETYTVNFRTTRTYQGKDGADGQQGQDGTDGADGFSPTVAVEEITGGHRVTITDETGPHAFDVMDGGAGTLDYDDLNNLPTLNGVEISGDKTGADYGLSDRLFEAGTGTNSIKQVTGPDDANIASGDFAIAFGSKATASGLASVVIGAKVSNNDPPTASGVAAVSLGGSNKATNNYAVALGMVNTASGNSSVAVGRGNQSTAGYAVTGGLQNTASATAAVALGRESEASGAGSAAIGYKVISNGRACAVLGQANIADTSPVDNAHGTGSRELLMIVGNGDDENNRSNALTLDWDGNLTAAGKMTVGAAPVNDMDVATKKYVDDNAGGEVSSVNGQTGAVVLDADDVGALPDDTVIPSKTSDLTNDSGFVNASGAANAAPVQSVNGKTGTVVLNASDVGAGTYSKPSGGIPASDLASAVQTSLGKADTALQSYTETDPTVPSWAKADSKPSYTKSEVGLGNVDNVQQYSASNPPPYPVSSVNGQTGAVGLSIPSTAADVGAEPAVTEVTISTAGAVTQALDAGKIYHFTGALSSLTLTFNAAGTGQIAQYHFDFDAGSTAPTVTLPNSVTMQGGTFTPEASKHYEVDILNGYGVSMAW